MRFRATQMLSPGVDVGLTALLALCGASLVRAIVGEWFPVSTATALMLLVVTSWVLAPARSPDAARRAFLSASSLLPIPVFLWIGALKALAEPLVQSWREFGPLEVALLGLIPPLVVFLAWACTAVGKAMIPSCMRGGRALRLCAWSLFALAILVAALATARARHFPAPDDYVASMPVVGHVLPRPQMPPADVIAWGDASTTDETDVDGAHIRRICETAQSAPRCAWRLDPAHGPFAEAEIPPPAFSEAVSPYVSPVIRHDARINVWVLDAGNERGGVQRWAFHHGDPTPRDLGVSDIAARASPPRLWIVGAWLGIAIAFVLLMVRTKPVVDPPGRWVEGYLLADGIVLAKDGRKIATVPPGGTVPTGHVAVLLTTSPSVAGYRDAQLPDVQRMHSGTLADVALAAKLPSCVRSVMAMAEIVLTIAPLGAAACVGLLG